MGRIVQRKLRCVRFQRVPFSSDVTARLLSVTVLVYILAYLIGVHQAPISLGCSPSLVHRNSSRMTGLGRVRRRKQNEKLLARLFSTNVPLSLLAQTIVRT
ncbi:hypothetical protein BDQ12DRAFT_63862 [Crucibulum laeve]|uniref:Uncharacterized protein n=1 Tax=Crucibulum laeve TaxID=68775 RepID=A0A5C3LTD6_9AGAR|nr:hypothetical protein BDQ12DRAFT_63862 [Crucibulum laeve]